MTFFNFDKMHIRRTAHRQVFAIQKHDSVHRRQYGDDIALDKENLNKLSSVLICKHNLLL